MSASKRTRENHDSNDGRDETPAEAYARRMKKLFAAEKRVRQRKREQRRKAKKATRKLDGVVPNDDPTNPPASPPSPLAASKLTDEPTEIVEPNPPPILPSRQDAEIKKLKLQPEFQKRLEDTLIRVHVMQETENGRKYLAFCENLWKKLSSKGFKKLVWDYFCRGLEWSLKAGKAFCVKCVVNPDVLLMAMLLGFMYKLYYLAEAAGEVVGEAIKTGAQYAYNQTIFVAGTAADASIVAFTYVKTAVTWFFENVIFKIYAKLKGLVGKQLLIAYNAVVGEGTGAPLLAAPTEEEGPTAQDHIESALSEHDVDWEEDPDKVYGKILDKVDEVIEENGVTSVNAEVRLQEKIEEANKRLRIGESVAKTELQQYIDRGKRGRSTLQDLARQITDDQAQFASNAEYKGNEVPFWTDRRSKAQIAVDTMGERLEQIDSINEAQMDLKSYIKKFNLLKQNPQERVDGLLKEHDMLSEMSNKLAGLWNSPAVKLLRENVLDPKSASEIFVTQFGKLIVATVTAQQAVLAGLLQHYEKKVRATKQTKNKSKHEKFKAKLEQLNKRDKELKTQQRKLSKDPLVQIEFVARKPVEPRKVLSIDYSGGQDALSGGASSGQSAIGTGVVADQNPLQRPMRVDYASATTSLVNAKYKVEECEEEK